MQYIRRFTSYPFPAYPNCPVMHQDTTVVVGSQVVDLTPVTSPSLV